MNYDSSLARAVDPSADKPMKRDEEYALAKQQFSMFTRALDSGHREYLDIKEKCNNFYIGGGRQWDPKDKAKLESEGRPALEINMVLSTVNVILGEQIGRRMDIQYKPRMGATDDSAHALTRLAMAIADANQQQWKEFEIFSDGLIEERGYYDVRIDFSKNLNGDVKITTVDGGDVIPDPEASSYDPAEWKEVYRTRWYSLDEIEEEFGEKSRKKLEAVAGRSDHFGKESIRRLENTFGDTELAPADAALMDNDPDMERFVSKVRVVERQFYKNVTVYCLVDLDTGRLRELPVGTDGEGAKLLAERFQTGLHKKVARKVRWRITADQFVLHDEWSPYRTFTIIPYFPYFRRGKPFGVVRNLLSPQEQYNKLSSQELHIVNTTANSGYIVEKGALYGMTADDLRAQGSKTGVVIEVNPGKKDSVEKIKPNQIPTGIDRITMKSGQNIKEISGVSDALLGQESAEVSGVALESKERRGQVQIMVPLDNLARTRHLLARKLLELMQDYYTDERMVQFTNDLEPGQPNESMVINERQEDGTVANDVTTGEYDIVISTMPARDNYEDAQFAEALNLRNVGVQIPGYRVVQYSNLMHKDKISEELRELEGLGEQTPEQQQMSMRTMMAELEEKEASVDEKLARAKELQSQAELNAAKAEETARAEIRQNRELEFKDAIDQRNTNLRERLGTLSAVNDLDKAKLQSSLKENGARNERED